MDADDERASQGHLMRHHTLPQRPPHTWYGFSRSNVKANQPIGAYALADQQVPARCFRPEGTDSTTVAFHAWER